MHDIERWKRSLLTLADASFFDLMRNYLGELRTPFNKHSLIEELAAFLKRPATSDRILELIDERDAQLLSAIEVLGEPSPDRLRLLFEGELGYLELHHRVLNLEERLLCYRERADAGERVRLNPLLRERLLADVVRPELVFPSTPAKPGPAPAPWLDEPLFTALVSYLVHAGNPLKSSGGFRKRSEEELMRLLPSLRAKSDDEPRLSTAIRTLTTMGLISPEETAVAVDVERWRALAALDARSRALNVWAAACAVNGAAAGPLAPRARLLLDFLGSLDAARSYPLATLQRLLTATAHAEDAGPPAIGGAESGPTLSGLVRLGVLAAAGRGALRLNPIVRALLQGGDAPAGDRRGGGDPEIILQPNFAVSLTPGVSFDTALTIAFFAELRQLDVVARYEITKRSFLDGLDKGLDGAAFCEGLERASGRPLPQNVQFSIKSWETEFRSVALWRGVVLVAEEERRHVIDHSTVMRPWIRKVLAPGVYLLDPRDQAEWAKALERLGVSPLPDIRDASYPKVIESVRPSVFEALGAPRPHSIEANRAAPKGAPAAGAKRRAALFEQLGAALSKRSLPREQHAELAARLEKKLILFPEQIREAPLRLEKLEAKGVDYLGKVRLIEQAIGSGTELLEVLERTPAGDNRRLLVRPVEVRRAGAELVLVGTSLPGEASVQIQVRKMGLVRKLKGSIFTP